MHPPPNPKQIFGGFSWLRFNASHFCRLLGWLVYFYFTVQTCTAPFRKFLFRITPFIVAQVFPTAIYWQTCKDSLGDPTRKNYWKNMVLTSLSLPVTTNCHPENIRILLFVKGSVVLKPLPSVPQTRGYAIPIQVQLERSPCCLVALLPSSSNTL